MEGDKTVTIEEGRKSVISLGYNFRRMHVCVQTVVHLFWFMLDIKIAFRGPGNHRASIIFCTFDETYGTQKFICRKPKRENKKNQ